MALPSFTAEAAVYSARGLYRASGSVEAGPHVAYTAQQLATVAFKAGVLKKWCIYPCPERCFDFPDGTGGDVWFCHYPCEPTTCLWYWS
jgi:hypothetical protein